MSWMPKTYQCVKCGEEFKTKKDKPNLICWDCQAKTIMEDTLKNGVITSIRVYVDPEIADEQDTFWVKQLTVVSADGKTTTRIPLDTKVDFGNDKTMRRIFNI